MPTVIKGQRIVPSGGEPVCPCLGCRSESVRLSPRYTDVGHCFECGLRRRIRVDADATERVMEHTSYSTGDRLRHNLHVA